MKVEVGVLGDVESCLLDEAKANAHGRIGVNAVRTTAVRIFENVYGGSWKKAALDSVDIGALFEQFKKNTRGMYGERTLDVYYARLKRAFDIYRSKNEKIEDIQIATRDFERQVKMLMAQIDRVRESFEVAATQYLFTDEAREDYNVYAIPISGEKPVALAVPKTIKGMNARMIKMMAERACSRLNEMEGR